MSGLLVVCLCAEWCDTCRKYRPEFEALGREFPMHRFLWIDIEDQAELVVNIEVENFPTLLIAEGKNLLFAGTMLPHIGHLHRLLRTLDGKAAAQVGKLPVTELAAFRSLAEHLGS